MVIVSQACLLERPWTFALIIIFNELKYKFIMFNTKLIIVNT